MLSMTAGACVKLAASWILSGIPGMGIRSAPISTVLCYAVMAACSLAFTVKVTGIRLSPVSMLWKPGMASVLCAGSAAALYGFLLPLLPETAAVLLAVGFAACVYLAAIVLLRGIDRETLSALRPALSGKKKK